MIITFITSRNKPRVTMVIGRVKKIIIGFINILQIDNAITTTIAVEKSLIVIPGSIYARNITERAEAINFKSHFILSTPFTIVTSGQ
jgi:hypothetical protein